MSNTHRLSITDNDGRFQLVGGNKNSAGADSECYFGGQPFTC